jgi:hypothetical protein
MASLFHHAPLPSLPHPSLVVGRPLLPVFLRRLDGGPTPKNLRRIALLGIQVVVQRLVSPYALKTLVVASPTTLASHPVDVALSHICYGCRPLPPPLLTLARQSSPPHHRRARQGPCHHHPPNHPCRGRGRLARPNCQWLGCRRPRPWLGPHRPGHGWSGVGL